MARGVGRGAVSGVIATLLLSTAPITQIAAQSTSSASAPTVLEMQRGALGDVNAALSLLAAPVIAAQPTVSAAAPAPPPPATPAAAPKTAAKHPAPAHPDRKLAAAHRQEPAKKPVVAAKQPAPAHDTKIPATTLAAARTEPAVRSDTSAAANAAAASTPRAVSPPPTPAKQPQVASVQPARAAEPLDEIKATAVPVSLTRPPETNAAPVAIPVTLPAVVVEKPLAPPASAAQPGDRKVAGTFVADFLKDAFRIAKLSGATSLQRRAQLAELFASTMDVKRIAGYTTANGLAALPPEMQQRFRTILVSYLVETYYPQLELASDRSVRVETTAGEPLADGTTVVWTTFTKDGWGSQSVKWQLANENGSYKIVDIFSASASLVQMERDTFQSVMRNGGLNTLMAKLDARTKELASAATE